MNDDYEPWWEKITLPHVLGIALLLLILFCGVRCEFHLSSQPDHTSEKQP